MIQILMLPSTQPPYPGCDASELERAFPNKNFITTFITLYWEHFHPILPVIHRPSFCVERTPSILLIAMVSIGASYSKLKNAKSFADGLSELCKRCLAWMVSDHKFSDYFYGGADICYLPGRERSRVRKIAVLPYIHVLAEYLRHGFRIDESL